MIVCAGLRSLDMGYRLEGAGDCDEELERAMAGRQPLLNSLMKQLTLDLTSHVRCPDSSGWPYEAHPVELFLHASPQYHLLQIAFSCASLIVALLGFLPPCEMSVAGWRWTARPNG